MAVEIPQLIVTIILVFFLPGYTLVQAIFPRKNELSEKDDMLHRIILAVGLSMAIFMFSGFALAGIDPDPETGLGFFRSVNIVITLTVLTVLFFIIGLVRGAYPRLGFRKERPVEHSLSSEEREELIGAMREWRAITMELESIRISMARSSQRENSNLKRKEQRLLARAEELEEGLKGVGLKDIDRGDRSSRLQALIHEWRKVRTQAVAERRKAASAHGAQKEHHQRELGKLESRLEELDNRIERLRDQIS